MSKHTPGPWMLPHFARPEVNCECGYVLTEEHFGAIATVHASGEGDIFLTGDNPNFEQAVANAHLIAAAPDLLEALEALDALWSESEAQGVDFSAAIAKARAAIAKATGAGHE